MKNYTDNSSKQTLIDANSYTDAQINTINSRVDNLDNKVDKTARKPLLVLLGRWQ